MTTGIASPGYGPRLIVVVLVLSLAPESALDVISMPAEAARPRMETAGLTAWYGSTGGAPRGEQLVRHQPGGTR